MLGERARGGQKHAVGDAPRAGRRHRKPHGREDEHVVALGNADFSASVLKIGERRARGDQRAAVGPAQQVRGHRFRDRKSTRLNSSHTVISYAVFCLKKKKTTPTATPHTTPAMRV